MSSRRRIRLWDALVARAGGGHVTVATAGAALAEVAAVDAVSVLVALPDGGRETAYLSGPLAADVEDLADTYGESPGHDAPSEGPVLVDDLLAAESLARWPVFAPAAAAIGARAVYALPLGFGAIRLGVANLYRMAPGALRGESLAGALMVAETIGALLLDGGTGPRSVRWYEQMGPHHPEVHQATGMISVQLGVTAAIALIRLRAYAYANERRLRDVAADVVARRLRFVPDGPGGNDVVTDAGRG